MPGFGPFLSNQVVLNLKYDERRKRVPGRYGFRVAGRLDKIAHRGPSRLGRLPGVQLPLVVNVTNSS